MFFRHVLALTICVLLGCGASSTRVERPIRAPDLQRIGPLSYAALEPDAATRTMELWVRMGAFDSQPPQHSTALAWSFESESLEAAVFPFSTRFRWSCGLEESFSGCAKRGLVVLEAPPSRFDVEAIRARLVAGRLASASSNPDAREALDALLDEVFDAPARLHPLGEESDDTSLAPAALPDLWERYYGANNAILVSRGYGPKAYVGLSTRTLHLADDRFAVPSLSLSPGGLVTGETPPGYQWTAVLTTCFEAIAELRSAVLRLEPGLISHLIDVRGHGYLAIFLGPPPQPEHRDFLHTLVSTSRCQTEDPLMRWLIGELGLDTTR